MFTVLSRQPSRVCASVRLCDEARASYVRHETFAQKATCPEWCLVPISSTFSPWCILDSLLQVLSQIMSAAPPPDFQMTQEQAHQLLSGMMSTRQMEVVMKIGAEASSAAIPSPRAKVESLLMEDLIEYGRRFGEKSPSMIHCFLFCGYHALLESRLSARDVCRYQEAILTMKAKDGRGETEAEKRKAYALLTRLHEKARAADPAIIETLRSSKSNVCCWSYEGLRVRLRAEPAKRGIVLNPFAPLPGGRTEGCQRGSLGDVERVHFDDEAAPREVYHNELKTLCAGCREVDGSSLCSRCQREPYCSRVCQERAWAAHKRVCVKASD